MDNELEGIKLSEIPEPKDTPLNRLKRALLDLCWLNSGNAKGAFYERIRSEVKEMEAK